MQRLELLAELVEAGRGGTTGQLRRVVGEVQVVGVGVVLERTVGWNWMHGRDKKEENLRGAWPASTQCRRLGNASISIKQSDELDRNHSQ